MTDRTPEETTHFGYEDIPASEKVARVGEVFHSVAGKYDLMNDLMSFGIHRLWKRHLISLANVRQGQTVLDLAGGTGDLAYQFSKRVGSTGQVILADINASMLSVGRDRLIDRGVSGNTTYLQANAECLPIANNSVDLVTIAFGLRNVTDQAAALASMYKILKPGGQCMVLEFSKPTTSGLKALYDKYSFSVLPKVGEWVTGDRDSYQYLVESIRKHPDQQTLKTMMNDVGFDKTDYQNLSGGIVALHRGYKY